MEANAQLVKQVDALTVMRARALTEKNPTAAVAVLKHLSAGSPKLAEAHGIAEAAHVRGVAWAMQTGDTTPLNVELSPDTSRLLEASLQDGMIRVSTSRAASCCSRSTRRARCVGPERPARARTQTAVAPELLDPATGNVERLAIPPMSQARGTESETGALRRRATTRVDPRRREAQTTPLWPDHEVQQHDIAPTELDRARRQDARGCARREGTELAHRDGKITLVEISRCQMAVMEDRKGSSRRWMRRSGPRSSSTCRTRTVRS
jgi:hypothetical protein